MNHRHNLALVPAACALLAALAAPARAEPVTRGRTLLDVDWTHAAVGGIGSGGTASLAVSGVSGTVTHAFLYWHGIDHETGDGVYDNEAISFAGNAVTGTSLGDATTNCWGDGSSRAFFADVTAYVAGDGTYGLSGLASKPGHDANGASLIVVFNDGNPANDRDLVFFEGNDSNDPAGFPGEDSGWHGFLEGINYQGGTVRAQLHLGDGQDFQDGALVFESAGGEVTLADDATLWDGTSTPTAGASRATNGELWDVHTFDLGGAFAGPGVYTLTLDGQAPVSDCLGLVLVLLDMPFGSAPRCGDGILIAPEVCDDGNTEAGDCCSPTCEFEPLGTACAGDGNACTQATCDGAGTCDPLRAGECRTPVAPGAAVLLVRDRTPDTKDRLDWKWKLGTATAAELGDPLATTGYELCVYDQAEGSAALRMQLSVPPGGVCGRRPCWKTTRTGLLYRNRTGTVRKLVLKGGLPGRASLVMQGQGAGLGLPAMPLTPAVTVQLRSTNGLCLSSSHTVPQTNTPRTFKGRSD
jgi:cysteine-rich repeat protein